MAAWPRRSSRVVRPRSSMAIWVASRMPKSVPSRVTVSFTRRARTAASSAGIWRTWWAMSVPVPHAVGADDGRCAPRGMALHVHGHGVHRDVGGGDLHVHGESGRIAAQPLGADAEAVHRLDEGLLEGRPLRIGARAAERPRGGLLGERHAEIRGAADPHADDGGGAGLAAGVEHAVDDE